MRPDRPNFQSNVLDGAGGEEVQDRRVYSASSDSLAVGGLLKRCAADSGSRGVYLSDAGNGCCSGDPICGKRVAVIHDGGQGSDRGIALGPGEGTDGGGDIYAPAEGMRLQGHGLGLGEAGFLHGNSVQQDPSDGDRIDGRMDENVSRNAG